MPAAVVDVDDHELGALRKDRRLPEVQSKIERHADEEDQGRLTKGRAASAWKEKWMTRREHAAGHSVDAKRKACSLDQLPQLRLGVRPPNAAAGNDRRLLGGLHQARCLRYRVRVGGWTEVWGQMLGRLRDVGGTEERVDGNVHKDGTGAPAQRGAHRFGGHPVRLVRGFERHGLLADRLNDGDVVQLLERAHAPPRLWRAAANQEHRAVARTGLGESRRRVVHAWTGGDRRNSTLPGR